MLGANREGKGPFMFDTEEKLRKDKTFYSDVVAKIEKRTHELRKQLSQGASSKQELSDIGTLLQGYDALESVIDQIVQKSKEGRK